MTGRVLIVMRTKNRPLLLGRALDSVLAQTYGGWRLVIVNDGGEAAPVDALVAARQDALAGRGRVIHNAASIGMEAASNIALRSEQAEFAVIHDDDDSWQPEFLTTTTTALAALPARWGGVVTHSRLVRERISGGLVTEVESVDFNAALAQITIGDLAAVNQFPPISFLYRTAVLAEIGHYREDLPVLGDWEFNLRFIQRFDIQVIPAFLANWHHRVSEAPAAGYENSFQAVSHDQFAAMLRNDALRADLAAGRFGLGELMSRGAMIFTELSSLRELAAKTAQARIDGEHRDLLTAQHVSNIEAMLRAKEEMLGVRDAQLLAVQDQLVAQHKYADGLHEEAALQRNHIHNLDGQIHALNEQIRSGDAAIHALNEQIRSGDAVIHALNEQIRSGDAVIHGLKDQVRSLEGHIHTLEGQMADLEKTGAERIASLDAARERAEFQARERAAELEQARLHAGALEAQLRFQQAQLDGFRASTSWRLTAPLRRLSSLLTRLPQWVGPAAFRWRRHTMTAIPLHDAAVDADGFMATGPDPQLLLQSDRGHLPRGLALMEFEGETADGSELAPDLYVHHAVRGTWERLPLVARERVLRLLPPDTANIRIDPMEREGGFKLPKVSAIEIGRVSLLLYRLLSAIRLRRRDRSLYRRRREAYEARKDAAPDLLKQLILDPTTLDDPYELWIRRYDTLSAADRANIRRHIAEMPAAPLISVLMPVYNPSPRWLERAIASVRGQLYENWEMCIADDASTDPAIRSALERQAQADRRIKVVFRERNGHISASSNSALEVAAGEFVALLDHDDELPDHALYCIAAEIARYPSCDILFSDEDKIDEEGRRYHPYFKSDWNPDLNFSQNAISHLGVYRTSLLREVGGFRIGFEGSQDLDLALRASERTTPDRIRHIPRILYHWRSVAGSTARAGSEKSYAWLAGRRALEEALLRRGIEATVEEAANGSYYRVRYPLPDPAPKVSLFIPTRDRVDLLRNCVSSILEKTDYPDFEIIIIDNDSVEAATLAYLREVQQDPRVRVLSWAGAFNFSTLNNEAARIAAGSVFGLINNDIETIDAGWLTEMVSHALRPEIGIVGAMLYYRHDHIQHAGVVVGLGGVAGHLHAHLPRGHSGYFGRAAVIQDFSAVTAACMVLRREVFEEVGGLDEVNLPVAFNDIDFCLRVGERGYRILWTPYAELYHLESATRGSDEVAERRPHFEREIAYMRRRWKRVIASDPFYNLNLSLDHRYPHPAVPPRVGKPWRTVEATPNVLEAPMHRASAG